MTPERSTTLADFIGKIVRQPGAAWRAFRATSRWWTEDDALLDAALRERSRLRALLAARAVELGGAASLKAPAFARVAHAIEAAIEAEARRAVLMARFEKDFEEFCAKSVPRPGRPALSQMDMLPCLDDRVATTPFDRHYTYHAAWGARVLARTNPERHVDISSTLAFCTIASAFVPIDFYDFRPAAIELTGLRSRAADLTALPFADVSIKSLSCMHVLEHIGLGRYGDPIDPDGDLKAIAELVRVVSPGGDLLVVTPVGAPRIQFNAHRIYDPDAFAASFAPLELVEFALIEESGDRGILVSPPPEVVRQERYGCGCFWFRRRAG